ncbi:PRC-barrel domain-containing protein [Mesorhizobium sp. ORS 3428]|uniref:PRC-barrel domain-containing protein n=1 Tax=Mesorhizobium sp. ORS 3428 TaxID=540997 RepID=UPI0008DA8ACE|nr:PRC-barrel domain-containing protein [Mesorhizobium sp. ORS 3428]OHV86782.1 photosystem reaction center subunit H [Mesorhizobium sp. ORS 3428]
MRKILIAIAAISALATPATAAATPPTGTYVTAKPTDWITYNLIGLKIVNGSNETVGEIKDLLISNSALAGYVVSVGGFVGIAERYVIVAPSAVKINYSENDKKWTATMDATKDQLKAAPEFKYEGRWSK